jgi:hypothetical protein
MEGDTNIPDLKIKKKVGFDENTKKTKSKQKFILNDVSSYIKECMILYTVHHNEKLELWNKYHLTKKPSDKYYPSHLNKLIGKYIIKRMKNEEKKMYTDGEINKLVKKKRIIKLISSDGIVSFKEDDKWDEIYFLDLHEVKNYTEGFASCYKLSLSNNDKKWIDQHIYNKLTGSSSTLRSKIAFNNIEKQLNKDLVLMFQGTIDYLFI